MDTPRGLRNEIRAAEIGVASLGRDAPVESVLTLFRQLDRIQSSAVRPGAAGLDLRAERARIETIHNVLREKAPLVDRALAGSAQWRRLRRELDPAPDRWWWFLDEQMARVRARRLRRVLWTGLVTGAALVVLGLLYVRFLRPDRATRTRIAQLSRAESLVAEGDYAAALVAYGELLEMAPDDPDVHLMLGIAHEAMAQPDRAAAYYAEAEAQFGQRSLFLAEKSRRYLALGWYEESEAAALGAIALDTEYAIAYCHLGSTQEAQGRVSEAIAAVRQCAELAQEQGQDELYVTATMRLGVLLRSPAPDVRSKE